MQKFTHFSKHAFSRVAQRTNLSCEEISGILDRGLALNTGREPGFNRCHLLFYSPAEDDFFVAIQDSLTGTVVTILPLEYHANLAWSISAEDCEKARAIYIAAAAKPKAAQQPIKTANFVISGHYLDGSGEQKTKVLKKIDSAPYGHDLKRLLCDERLLEMVGVYANEKQIDFASIFGISVRHGNKGAPILIDLNAH